MAMNSILLILQYATCKYSKRGSGRCTLNSSLSRWHLTILNHSRLEQFDNISSRPLRVTLTTCRSSFFRLGKPQNWEDDSKDTKLSCRCCRRDMLSSSNSSMGNLYLSGRSPHLAGSKSRARFFARKDKAKLTQQSRCSASVVSN